MKSALLIYLFFSIYFFLLFTGISLLDIKKFKSVKIYEDGIRSYNSKKRKVEIKYDEIGTVEFDKFQIDNKHYIIKSRDETKELFIPFPLNDWQILLETLSKQVGDEHILIKELSNKIT